MLGISFRRAPWRKLRDRYLSNRTPTVDVAIDSLVDKFNLLDINTISPSRVSLVRSRSYSPLANTYFQKRFYSTNTRNKIYKDLDQDGTIKAEILEARRKVLLENGLLEDEFLYEGRIVYANKHLYDLNQTDSLGRSNFQRMQSGFCPVDSTGEDIIVIHHFDQTMSGPWVILTNRFHEQMHDQLHSDIVLKDKVRRKQFALQRRHYWKYQLQCELNRVFKIRKD
ncbi:MAG: HNH/ENDO VII family nuclease [Candidatus Berkiella sp.]